MDSEFPPIRRALLSVSDKTGLIELARALHEKKVELIATGGTAQALRDAGLPLREVSDITQFPELMDGRLKTLHPRIHGGLLGRRDNADHRLAMKQHGIEAIDLLVVNLYPFEKTLQRDAEEAELIENIDIGGPAMIRAAAKNHSHVCVVTSPREYPILLAEMQVYEGATGPALRKRLAAQAYQRTSLYDAMISGWMAGAQEGMPTLSPAGGKLEQQLRYGENPHQRAALYLNDEARPGAANAQLLQGKPPGYNNLLDADAAFELIAEFDPKDSAAVAIIKHGIPCGVALRESVAHAYCAALQCDPVSAFGGVVASNRAIDRATAEEIVQQFTEVVIAPAIEEDALALFSQKPALRILATGGLPSPDARGFSMRSIAGGVLVQDRDSSIWKEESLQVVTKRKPSKQEWRDLRFAFNVCKHVKSNAIVIAHDATAIGIGGGQVSRIEAVLLAAERAKLELPSSESEQSPLLEQAEEEVRVLREGAQGKVLASDGFFPFTDGVKGAAREGGVCAIVQPGGSKKDEEVIAAAAAADIAMVFTGTRQFRH